MKRLSTLICFWLFLFSGTAALADEAPCSSVLVPLPRQYTATGKMISGKSEISIEDKFGMPQGTIHFMETEFLLRSGTSRKKNTPTGFHIYLLRCSGKELYSNDEAYKLEISSNRNITLKAATREGMFRAVGRLLCILSLSDFPADGLGNLILPELTLHDAPVFPWRSLDFTTNLGRPYSKELEKDTKRTLDAAAKLGFNRAWFSFGGRWESRRHPEFVRHPAWPLKKVQELIQYANNRGIRAMPATNVIGHVKGAPRLPMLSGKYMYKGKNTFFDELIMDLSHPSFFRLWFDFLDEYCALFQNPEYCHIGTDEFHRGLSILENKLGQKYRQFYPDLVNRTSKYLAAKGIRTVIAHDMLMDAKQYRVGNLIVEEANGECDLLEKINSDVLIGYWNYTLSRQYSLLEKIAASNHDFTVTLWTNFDNARSLPAKAHRLRCSRMTCGFFGLKGYESSLPIHGEYFWNPVPVRLRSDAFYQSCNSRLFSNRQYRKVQKIKNIPLNGGKPIPDFAKKIYERNFPQSTMQDGTAVISLHPVWFGLDVPLREVSENELLQGKNSKIMATVDGAMEYIPLGKLRINQSNRPKGFNVYTSAFGKSTRTNRFGHEFSIEKGTLQPSFWKITALETQGGNMKIPEKGFVLSAHHAMMEREVHPSDFMQSLRPGRKIHFFELPGKTSAQQLKIKLNKKAVFYFWLPFPIEKERGVFFSDPPIFSLSIGKNTFLLKGRDIFYPNRLSGSWSMWNVRPDSMTNFVFAIETPEIKEPAEMTITVFPRGRIAGLTLLTAGTPNQ